MPNGRGAVLLNLSAGANLTMTGELLMKGLIGAYLILAGVFLYERNWAKAWYWLGAAQITASVVMMK